QRNESAQRLPPGQYLVESFPVLSAGPTPHIPLAHWDFLIAGELDEPQRWTLEEFQKLPHETISKDIHCVTKWSTLDTTWTGGSFDSLLDDVTTIADYVLAFSDGGLTANLPLEDVTGRKAWSVDQYERGPL